MLKVKLQPKQTEIEAAYFVRGEDSANEIIEWLRSKDADGMWTGGSIDHKIDEKIIVTYVVSNEYAISSYSLELSTNMWIVFKGDTLFTMHDEFLKQQYYIVEETTDD